ncbi:SGNH/GDSL hydrolase family protein [Planctomicrobium sp. SH661]|uniref:SGNH/GDSL hydrolase family protein n=1 Tax=Planctomicrobium sp. SH661 TaxID=3448124 RepID=UPI003F5B5DF4
MSTVPAVQANEPERAEKSPSALKLGELPVGRILYLGNSITRHPPAVKDGHAGDWGMAASAPEKDYVHLLTAKIGDAAHGKPESLAKNIADFERGFQTYDIEKELKEELAFQPDLVIVAIGENVPVLSTDELKSEYAAGFSRLLATLKQHGNPTIVVRSMFWADPVRDDIMRKASEEAGVLFVQLQNLGADPQNQANSEREVSHPGVGGHPGDKGMQAIADALWQGISKASAAAK